MISRLKYLPNIIDQCGKTKGDYMKREISYAAYFIEDLASVFLNSNFCVVLLYFSS